MGNERQILGIHQLKENDIFSEGGHTQEVPTAPMHVARLGEVYVWLNTDGKYVFSRPSEKQIWTSEGVTLVERPEGLAFAHGLRARPLAKVGATPVLWYSHSTEEQAKRMLLAGDSAQLVACVLGVECVCIPGTEEAWVVCSPRKWHTHTTDRKLDAEDCATPQEAADAHIKLLGRGRRKGPVWVARLGIRADPETPRWISTWVNEMHVT